MNDNLANDVFDENSDYNAKREELEKAFMQAGAALLDHTLAAKIRMVDFGVVVTLERAENEALN